MARSSKRRGGRAIILLGPPGSGKDTVFKSLAGHKIATGALCRHQAQMRTRHGRRFKRCMNGGALMRTAWLFRKIKPLLFAVPSGEDVIMNGGVRKVYEWRLIRPVLRRLGFQVVFLWLTIPEDVAVFRIGGRRICANKKCGKSFHSHFDQPQHDDKNRCDQCQNVLTFRKDDSPEVIRQRFHTFVHETEPLRHHLKDHASFHVIDATGSPEDVRARVSAIV